MVVVGSTSIHHILQGIKSGDIKKIVVLTGAGISCSSGIPDFRSAGGLYDTLKPELITASEAERNLMRNNPTAVVDFQLFKRNQFPYLEVRRPFILGTAEQKWKPTLSHYFMKLLHDKGLLQRIYTQNIDGLDDWLNIDANTSEKKVVQVHGSLSQISCEFCGASYPIDEFRDEVKTKIRNIYDPNDLTAPQQSSNINCKDCHKPGVKPSTVMYGRSLPAHVFSSVDIDFPDQVDLMIVIGTSLTVYPACTFVTHVGAGVSRLVINRDVVGKELGLQYGSELYPLQNFHVDEQSSTRSSRDAILLGECDESVWYLLEQLGWIEDIVKYQENMCPASQALLQQRLHSIDRT